MWFRYRWNCPKANAGLDFHYHGPFDHYSSNSYIIKIKSANLTKEHNYTTVKIHSLLVEHPKIRRLDMTKDVKHLETSGKCSYRSLKKANMFKAKRLIEKGGTSYLIQVFWSPQQTIPYHRLPFHTGLKIPDAEHIHTLPIYLTLINTFTHIDKHTHTHSHTDSFTLSLSLSLSLSLTHTHTYIHSRT